MIATVCSKCAEREPSRVTTVQPLPSTFVFEIASYAQGMIDAPIYPYMLKPEEMKRLFTPYGLELIDYSE